MAGLLFIVAEIGVAAYGVLLWMVNFQLFGPCSTTTELVPAPDAQTLGESLVYTITSGVYVRAQGSDWPGNPDVKQHVTPVRLSVRKCQR